VPPCSANAAIGVKALGDGLAAALAAAADAIACAAEMQRSIDRQARRGPSRVGAAHRCRRGRRHLDGRGLFGTPVLEAQRLIAAAAAGSILVADAVRLLAGSGMVAELEDAGQLALRDLVRPVRAWAVRSTAQRTVPVRFPAALSVDAGATFVGRETELAELRTAWAEAAVGRGSRASAPWSHGTGCGTE
jgi:class 3 adenylate cyclase